MTPGGLLLVLLAEASPFSFGSYGRVGLSSDLEGGRGRAAQIVTYGPRLAEAPYLELDFGSRLFRQSEPEATRVDAVVTLAFGDALFHYDGKFEVRSAIRQAYVEAREVFVPGDFVWVGSRMYRGDDLYLFDLWPLDDLNTVGAAVGVRGSALDVTLHLGLTRLDSVDQVQRVAVPSTGFGATEVEVLDRQRAVASLQGEFRLGLSGATGLKLKVHTEAHHLPSGRRRLEGGYSQSTPLPDDRGFVVGAQVGASNFSRNGHAHLFVRAATGLAAYDPSSLASGTDEDRRVSGASEYRIAFSGNVEGGLMALTANAYVRAFFDADGEALDFDDRVESAVCVRPTFFVGRYFTPMVELSVQAMRPNGLNPRTLTQDTATVTQLALIPALTFGEAPIGAFTRPQLRATYAVSRLDDAALALYAAEDPRSHTPIVHFLGASAEWSFGREGGK